MKNISTKAPVSTKAGDKGQTTLANGQRVAKDHPVFTAIGTVDELNSWLGLVVARMGSKFSKHQKRLLKVQDTLFYVGAELARSPKAQLKPQALTQIEKASEKLQNSMTDDWHTKFVLPGGTELGAQLDIARTVCRRAERVVVAYNQKLEKKDKIRPVLVKYLNRLSDYLYVLRCFVNHSVDYSEREFDSKNS